MRRLRSDSRGWHFEDEETTMFRQAAQVLVSHLEEITVLLQERKAQILAS
jgi:hypothetical protein